MTPLLMAGLCVVMVGTSFLSGVFGMAGGMVLVGVLLALLPVPAAMALHAVTQIASNLWRAVLWRRFVRWRSAWPFMAGTATALGVWSLTGYVPSLPVALILLGASPFVARALPGGLRANPDSPPQGILYGGISMGLMLLTGVSGPLVDTFFMGQGGGGISDRLQIVATKAAVQVAGHAAKLAYFGAIIDQAAAVDPVMAGLAVACSMLGTTLARRLLEAMTDVQFRLWANRLITSISLYFLVRGAWLLLA